jgi:hypothetical protein
VTLALIGDGREPEALAGQILAGLAEEGLDPDALPDLLLCGPEATVADGLCVADAVLVADPRTAGPELTRRALALVTPAALGELRERLVGAAAVPAAV